MPQLNKHHPITAIIVDDERLAIKGIEILLEDYPHIQITGTADDLEKAARLIESDRPDLIFLDIQLQGRSGFELFERVPVDSKVVFVTAYDEYAIRAFEVNALDYLLKPVSRQRFAKTICRLSENESASAAKDQHFEYHDVIALNNGSGMQFQRLSKIRAIIAEGDYSRVRISGEKSELVYRTLKRWESMLPETYFIRIHRSAIVNIEHIDGIEPTTSHRYLVFLRSDEAPMVMSQRYAAQLKKRLGHKMRGGSPISLRP